jgi:hypothetical protein
MRSLRASPMCAEIMVQMFRMELRITSRSMCLWWCQETMSKTFQYSTCICSPSGPRRHRGSTCIKPCLNACTYSLFPREDSSEHRILHFSRDGVSTVVYTYIGMHDCHSRDPPRWDARAPRPTPPLPHPLPLPAQSTPVSHFALETFLTSTFCPCPP